MHHWMLKAAVMALDQPRRSARRHEHRPHRQRRELRAGKLPVGDREGAGEQPASGSEERGCRMMAATAEVFAPLFESAHGALVFAFNFSGQCYDRPMMNRLASPAVGSGKGLVGLDGAAQAGMIRAEVQTLGKLAEAIIIARIAPRTVPCHCRSARCARKTSRDRRRTRTWTAGCCAGGLFFV